MKPVGWGPTYSALASRHNHEWNAYGAAHLAATTCVQWLCTRQFDSQKIGHLTLTLAPSPQPAKTLSKGCT